MNISIGARTDVGGRSNNEDCLAVLDRDRVPLRADAVLVIADGMGGRSNGEEASGIAVKIVRETVMELLDPSNEQLLPPAEDILAAGIRRANSTIYGISQEHPDEPGMGTTCIAALISEGVLTLAHVGDSRAYLVRDNKIKSLTNDHTYVADQVRAGNMSVESSKTSRFRNVITRAIGIAPTVDPDFDTFPLLDSDTILLCTDGLTNTLEESDICEVVRRGDGAQAIAGGLLDAAKARGVRDNVTVIAVHVTSDVQPGRIKRGNMNGELNGKPVLEVVSSVDQKDTNKSTPPLLEIAGPVHTTSASSSSTGFRYVLVAVLFALLGAMITGAALYEAGLIAVPTSTNKQVTILARPLDYVGQLYLPPVQLFYKPIRPDFLLLGQKGAFVALAQSGKIIHLNGFGQPDGKAPVGTTAPPAQNLSLSYASDQGDNLYVSDSAAGTISQLSSDGTHRRVIAKNLVQPGAIAVDPSGTIYFVDGGELYVLHTHIPPGKL